MMYFTPANESHLFLTFSSWLVEVNCIATPMSVQALSHAFVQVKRIHYSRLS